MSFLIRVIAEDLSVEEQEALFDRVADAANAKGEMLTCLATIER
jgi:hypothetical protein